MNKLIPGWFLLLKRDIFNNLPLKLSSKLDIEIWNLIEGGAVDFEKIRIAYTVYTLKYTIKVLNTLKKNLYVINLKQLIKVTIYNLELKNKKAMPILANRSLSIFKGVISSANFETNTSEQNTEVNIVANIAYFIKNICNTFKPYIPIISDEINYKDKDKTYKKFANKLLKLIKEFK